MKEFADNNFKVDENGRKFSKWIENTVGKGEIARSEQFLLFQKCFQKACTADTEKPGLVWERVNKMYIIQYITDYKKVPPSFLKLPPYFSVSRIDTAADDKMTKKLKFVMEKVENM